MTRQDVPKARDPARDPPGPTILQIIPRLDTGGAELATLEIAEALRTAGARAVIATEGGRLAEAVLRRGAELACLPAASKNPVTMMRNVARLAALVEARDVALLHARSRAPAWSALLAARRTGRPFVTTYHGAYGQASPVKGLYNSVMARGDLVIANSRFTADLIRARHGTPEARIRVIYRGVDLDAFDPGRIAPERVAALRTAWGIGADVRIVLHAARLTGWKGQGVVIEAAGRLARHETHALPPWVVVLAGDAQGRTDYARHLEAQIARAGLKRRVRIVGHCADMPAAFCAAHVAVVASTEPEAFGRAATEAMAMGCPVIATDIGAPPETVLAPPAANPDEATGWLVPPGDSVALADRLIETLTMPAPARRAMGERARRHVARHFSLDQMKRQTLAVYDELLGAGLERRWTAAKSRVHGTPESALTS